MENGCMYYNYTLQELVELIMKLIVNFLPTIDQDDHHLTVVPSSKVMCIGIIANIQNANNHLRTLKQFEVNGLKDYVLDPSQFSRRVVRLDCFIPEMVEKIAIFAESELDRFPLKQTEKRVYVVDTKPIPICQNIRISNCHLVDNHKSKEKVRNIITGKVRKKVDEDYRGYCASKREYFYGLKLNLMKNCLDFPREYSIHVARTSDLDCYRSLNLNLQPNSEVIGDKAYNNLQLESDCKNLIEYSNLNLNPIRKRNTRQMKDSDYFIELAKRIARRPIETLFSQLEMKIQATSLDGFVMKIHFSVLGRSIQQLFKLFLS
jgi:hypothetical protein